MSAVQIRTVQGQRGIQQFTAQLNGFDVQLRRYLREKAQRVAFIIAEAVIVGNQYGPGTPVDWGFARANWTIGINTDAPGELAPRPATRTAYPAPDMSAIQQQISALDLGDVFRMANNAVYGMSLEYGHSTQAPSGMVRVVIAAGQTIVDDLVSAERSGR